MWAVGVYAELAVGEVCVCVHEHEGEVCLRM